MLPLALTHDDQERLVQVLDIECVPLLEVVSVGDVLLLLPQVEGVLGALAEVDVMNRVELVASMLCEDAGPNKLFSDKVLPSDLLNEVKHALRSENSEDLVTLEEVASIELLDLQVVALKKSEALTDFEFFV